MANVLFLTGTAAEYAALETKSNTTFYLTSDTLELYIGAKKITNAADLTAALNRLDGNESTVGSIRNVVKGYIEALDTSANITLASKSGKSITLLQALAEADGIVGAVSGDPITLADVASTGNAEDVAYDNTTSELNATDAQAALDELAAAVANATEAGAVTCETSSPVSGDVLRTYSFYQGVTASDDAAAKAAKKIVDVNVPRDYLVKAAEVKTVATADDPYTGAEVGDKYIDFTVNTKDSAGTATHLYIPVDDLMSAISAAQNATQVQVAISASNEISATLVAGGVGTTELATKAVTTAKIDDKAVTTAKIDDDAITGNQIADDAVGAEHIAISAHTESQTAGTDGLAISVTTTDGQVSGVSGSIAANTYDAYGAAATAKSEVIGESTDAASADTINGAKAYADGVAATAVEALDGSATIASKSGDVVTIKAGITETDGVIDNNSGSDIVLEEVATTGAAADVSVADSGNNFSGTTVEAVLAEIATALTWQAIS